MPAFGFPAFSTASVVANLLFSAVGFVAFAYGKRMQLWRTMFIGLALMIYSYFIANTILLFGLGAALTAALFIWRD